MGSDPIQYDIILAKASTENVNMKFGKQQLNENKLFSIMYLKKAEVSGEGVELSNKRNMLYENQELHLFLGQGKI